MEGVGVWLGKAGAEVGVGGRVVAVAAVSMTTAMVCGISVGDETRSDNLVSKLSIAVFPGPANNSQPMNKSTKTTTKLMSRAGVKIFKRSRNNERSGTAWLPGIKPERKSSSNGGVSGGFSES